MGDSDVLQLSSSPNAVPRARQFVAGRLRGAGLEQFADDAELAVAELVTNALLHAAPPVSLRVVPQDDTVRLEVQDGSRSAPVRVRSDPSSMTGRGLMLVDALALRWGVDPTPHGKIVWVELGPEQDRGRHTGQETDPDGDIDALLAAWADDFPADEHYAVHLGDVPTDLLLDAKAHIDSVVREFTLAESGAESGSSSAIPQQLVATIETVVHRFAEARLSIKRQALAAAARGDLRTDLTLTLPVSSAADAEAYLAGLDEADAYARAARLLTLETPPSHRTFRRWYIHALVTRLRALAAGEPPPTTETFEQCLLLELENEAVARRSLERIAGLQVVTAALAAATSVEDVAQVVVDEGVRTLGALGGGLLLPGDNGSLRVPVSIGYGDRLLHQLRTEPRDAELPAAEAMRTGTPVWLESPQERDARYPGLIGMEPGTMSLCAVPLMVGPRLLGALRFSFAEPRLFDEYERRFVLGLAAQTAQAIDRVMLYEAERGARERAESLAARLVRLQQVAEQLSRSTTVDEAAEVVVTHAARALGSGLATVSLLVDDDTLEVVQAQGISEVTRDRWQRYPLAAELPGSVAVRTGEPVVVGSVTEMEERFPLLAGQAQADSSLICVPMRVGSRTIGAISLNFPLGRDIASRSELAFFSSLADTAAQAVDRARTLASLETAVARLSFLADATSELAASLDYRETLSKIASLVVPRLADWCAVDLATADGEDFERVAVAHTDPAKVTLAQQLRERYPVDPAADRGVPRVVRSGVSELYVEISDEMLVSSAREAEHLRVARELGLSSALIVPLCGSAGNLGALSLIYAESGRQYSEDDLHFAEDIARRAGGAVERARAYANRDGSSGRARGS